MIGITAAATATWLCVVAGNFAGSPWFACFNPKTNEASIQPKLPDGEYLWPNNIVPPEAKPFLK